MRRPLGVTAGLVAASLFLTAGPVRALTFTVNSTLDANDDVPGDGICSAGGVCTLRAAVREANFQGTSANQTIVLPAGTYVLTLAGGPENAALTGDLDVTAHIILQGAGADVTVIDGGGIGRIFQVFGGLIVNGVTLRNGDAAAENETLLGTSSCDGAGGAICGMNVSTVTLFGSIIRDNRAVYGGGLRVFSNFSMTDTIVRDNRATGGGDTSFAIGGGIVTGSSPVSIEDSTVIGNSVETSGVSLAAGGGLFASGTGAITIGNSTFGGNVAPDAVAVHVHDVALCFPSFGCGPIHTGTVEIENSTIVESAASGGATIRADTATVRNSIVAGDAPVCVGSLGSGGYNLIQTPDAGCTITGATATNLLGVDPQLGPLGLHGGVTLTYRLDAGSPAIDAGNPAAPGSTVDACRFIDQRHLDRPIGPRCDIGAVEGLCANGSVDASEQCDDGNLVKRDGCTADCRLEVPHTFFVDSTADAVDDVPGDGACSAGGACTLRAAVQEANALPGADTIIVPAGTITLTRAGVDEVAAVGDLDVTDDLVVEGAGASASIVDGGNIARLFDLQGDAIVTVRDLALQHGNALSENTGSGGAISAGTEGSLSVERVTLAANVAASGGALESSRYLSVIDSRITGNQAAGDGFGAVGGGILFGDGGLVSGSTIDGNDIGPSGTYVGGGGAFWTSGPGTVTVRNSTVSGNDGEGGAIHAKVVTLCFPPPTGCLQPAPAGPVMLENVTVVTDGDPTLNTSIVSDQTTLRNTIVAGTALACSGALTSAGHNLVQQIAVGTYACPIGGDTTGNRIGVDPLLGPLGAHGGRTPTQAPLGGSPALDAGDHAVPGSGGNACLLTDQRGLVRPAGLRCDMGAVEGLCGNGVVDGGEECDDSNVDSGDGCDSECRSTVCGDGDIDPGEECDDGNTVSGDCCSSTCLVETAGNACDSGDACIIGTCDGAGACVLTPSTAPCCVFANAPCVGASKSSLAIRVPPNGRSTLRWSMSTALPVAASDFGDPSGTSDYEMCVYEQGGAIGKLAAAAPASALRWKPASTGFRYRANDLVPDGIKSITLRAGTSGRVKVTGRGPALPLGPLPFTGAIRVRLVRPDGPACWGADYPTTITNGSDKLKARIP